MTSRIPAAFGALACVLLLASCAAPAPTTQSPSATTTARSSDEPDAPIDSEPDAQESATPTTRPTSVADLDCETLITRGTVDALKAAGWTSQQQEFQIGDTTVEDGMMCLWADFSTPSDHGQMYALGAIDANAAQEAQAGLQRDGWLKSTDAGNVYFTEDPAYALATDEDGFGQTYEFGDGWVRFADTKQGLLLIETLR